MFKCFEWRRSKIYIDDKKIYIIKKDKRISHNNYLTKFRYSIF
jgi:hypothetical protein